MAIGSEHGISGVVLTTDDYDMERTARLMRYDGGGRSGGGSLLIFPENDDGSFYVLSFRNGRTQYDIDIRPFGMPASGLVTRAERNELWAKVWRSRLAE